MMDSIINKFHVTVIGDGSLLSEGVTQILATETDLHISAATYSDDHPFLEIVEWIPPDAILVCDTGVVEMGHIFNVLSSQQLVMGLLIIIIRLSTNMIDCYANASFEEGKIAGELMQIMPMARSDLINMLKRNHRN
jgi:hypothetical protein